MPTSVRTVNRLYVYLIFAVVVIAALTVAVIALVYSNRTADCVNDALASRNGVTQSLSAAELHHTKAELAHIRGQITDGDLARETARYRDIQARVAAARAANPLGRC